MRLIICRSKMIGLLLQPTLEISPCHSTQMPIHHLRGATFPTTQLQRVEGMTLQPSWSLTESRLKVRFKRILQERTHLIYSGKHRPLTTPKLATTQQTTNYHLWKISHIRLYIRDFGRRTHPPIFRGRESQHKWKPSQFTPAYIG
jgi:hypothetical protein